MIEALTMALVIIHDVEVVGVDLEAPDGHGVVDPDVPRSVDGQVSVDWHVADAALLLGEEHFLAPVRPQDGRLEAAIILLVDEGVGRFLAEDARVFEALLLHSGLRHCARDVYGQNLGKPVVARLRHVKHALGVVAAARRGDE